MIAAIILLTGSAFAIDPACKAAGDATAKSLTVPMHMYNTETSAGKTRNTEAIYVNGKAYVLVNGNWRVSPATPRMMQEAMQAANADPDSRASHMTCWVVRDEAVKGEAATLYSQHSASKAEKIDTQLWVSKSRGLPLKMEINIDVGGATGKSRRESRYEYSNVKAPAGAR